jgi:hypothetical protein
LLLQRADVSTAQVFFRRWLRSPLRPSVLLGKLFYAFEHDVFPWPAEPVAPKTSSDLQPLEQRLEDTVAGAT